MAEYRALCSQDVFDEDALDALLAPQAAALENQPLWPLGPQHYVEDFEHETLPRVTSHPDIDVKELTVRAVLSDDTMPDARELARRLGPLWDAVGEDGFVVVGSDWTEGDGYEAVNVRRKFGRSYFEFDAQGTTLFTDGASFRAHVERWIHAFDLPMAIVDREGGFGLEHTRGGGLRCNQTMTRPTGFFVEVGSVEGPDMFARLENFTGREMTGRGFDECVWTAGSPLLAGEGDALQIYHRIVENCPAGPYEVSIGYGLHSLRGLGVVRALADDATEFRNPYWNFHIAPNRKVNVNLVTCRAGHRVRLVSEHEEPLFDFAARLGVDFEVEGRKS